MNLGTAIDTTPGQEISSIRTIDCSWAALMRIGFMAFLTKKWRANFQQIYAAAPDNGAALAESCAACHGTGTNRTEGFENLLGESHYQDLIEMKYRTHPESIMDWVARTYTDQQFSDISQYFKAYGKKSNSH